MHYLIFSPTEQSSYEVCFLVPHLHRAEMEKHYLATYFAGEAEKVLAYDLHKESKRTPVKIQREYLDELLPTLQELNVKHLVTCDAEYFKTLTKAPKADAALGYVLDCAHPGFEHMRVSYCPNFRARFYNPEKVDKEIRTALTAVQADRQGTYIEPGMGVIKFCEYPDTVSAIEGWLQKLLDMNCDLASDIEGFSLNHYDAGIGTISFAWNKHEGIAFPVDLLPDFADQMMVRKLLRDFFEAFARKAMFSGCRILWHNIAFDAKVLVYQLWMKNLLDTKGLLKGLNVMTSAWEDTKLITYLATNSCAGNQLGLKVQAQEFAGNYAVEEITDIRSIPLPELLQYNLVDSLSTWFVFEKHWDTMVADQQLPIYTEIFKPGTIDIIQMQLTGLPLDMAKVKEVQASLQEQSDEALERMQRNPLIESFIYDWRLGWIEKENEKLKTKTRSYEEAEAKVVFNPNSNPQLQTLLYDQKHLGLPVIDLTDTKAPAVGKDTLEKLINHTEDPDEKDFLSALIDYKEVDKLLTAFIPHMLAAPRGPDGWHYLFGNFNLGGTVSGRLSSSGPNLQNLPANGRLAKLIKQCFKAPPGYLFIGLDFDSLEDKISALTTKDPNKLKVYTDGYDGHSLRAHSYFTEDMPDIDPSTVAGINAIKKKYPDLRRMSKAPTFALTYQGTWHTLVANCGFTEQVAQAIEAKYHELYRVSDEWVAARIEEATRTGYVTVAFGLRVRTPKLSQVILGNSRTPYEASAEGRTAGNALGQSWCLLNTRASIEFLRHARSSQYAELIRPCAHIHDAQYFLIPEDMDVLCFVEEHLTKAVAWQDHPDIAHPTVKLSGEVGVFYPDWSTEMTIPRGSSPEKIKELAAEHIERYCL